MTPRSKYGLPLEYLNLKQKDKSEVSDILWKSNIRVAIAKYASNESLHLL